MVSRPMRNFFKTTCFMSSLVLIGCGGGGGDSSSSSTSTPANGNVLSVSTTNVTFSGKQFGELAPTERVTFTVDNNVVSIVSMLITGDAKFEDRNIFSVSSDSSNSFADIRVDNSDIEGGTYQDTLILRPSLRSGGFGNTVTVNLTLVQEPTQPLTAELNDPGEGPVEITEGGPPIRIAASVITGSTIRWDVQPYRFVADDVDAVTTDPTEGVGSEQVEVVLTPTQTLIDSIKANGREFAIFGFQDRDHPGNFTELGFEVILAE